MVCVFKTGSEDMPNFSFVFLETCIWGTNHSTSVILGITVFLLHYYHYEIQDEISLVNLHETFFFFFNKTEDNIYRLEISKFLVYNAS